MSEPRGLQGFVVEVQDCPRWFAKTLEADGVVELAAWTIDGLYCEPTNRLDEVFARLDVLALTPTNVRFSGSPASWHEEVKRARLAERRLRNWRAAEWLPTFHSA